MKNQGISAIEYCVLVIVMVAAVMTMQVYLKRAMQGRWRTAADAIGFGWQYEVTTDPGASEPISSEVLSGLYGNAVNVDGPDEASSELMHSNKFTEVEDYDRLHGEYVSATQPEDGQEEQE
ncbi:MAG: hypothetical protein PHR44_08095 [Candidatus Omnitrophica bacterium]|nr:hypothetical protein [Candidatus Omnitrophota bacterium]